MTKRTRALLVAVLLAVLALSGTQCRAFQRTLVGVFDRGYPIPAGVLEPVIDGADAARPAIDVVLVPVIGANVLLMEAQSAGARAIEVDTDGPGAPVPSVTDMAFAPGYPDVLVLLSKDGLANYVDLVRGSRLGFFRVSVATESELGLLGIAFHPGYEENGRFFLNYNPGGSPLVTRIEEWEHPARDPRRGKPYAVRTVLEVEQPYQNHNAGQLAFGPDGYLYVGLGDGGFRADPDGNGQDAGTLLGSMLRLDVENVDEEHPYRIPADNPFVDDPAIPDEIYAIGLRNPWRYSFDPKGRLVVADVGQDLWEELSFVSAGDNLGWNVREGRHCFPASSDCDKAELVDPFYEYGRVDGSSITGGFVYTHDDGSLLVGKYLFGDFVTGRLWAMDLPESTDDDGPLPTIYALGRWPILPSTFARGPDGEVLVADFGKGVIYQISPAFEDDTP